ncbi:MAG: hypothetical protein Q8L34_06500 [Candidatus Woesearchaeota archaeon]|nr:hypothetical protein [Candidatus Woesearchaeota archaeon]
MTDLRLYDLKNRKNEDKRVLVVADENNSLLVDQAVGESNFRCSREVIRRQWLVESLRILTRDYDLTVRACDESEVKNSCKLYSPGTIVDLIVKIDDPKTTLKLEDVHLMVGAGIFEVVSGENVAEAKIREWMDRYQAVIAQKIKAGLRYEDEIVLLKQRIEKLKEQRQQEAQRLSSSISLQQLLN